MRSRRVLIVVLFLVVLFNVSQVGTSSVYIDTMDLRQEQSFQVAEEIGAVEFTEHGSKTYLGDNNWRYRSSVGETNTWNGSHYLRYNYDLENKQVSIGKLTFIHGPNGVISVSHSESGSMIGELKWYAQYYLSDQWNNFTFDNYEYLGATKTDENATVYQRWWSTNGELNVSYTYYYWNELKMRAQATNLAAQTVPVRVLWAMTDIRLTGVDYSLIYDNGVAVGVGIGNEQQIFWHDVTESAPEININPVLDKENRRAAVVFGNMSSTLAQYETMDIDPTYTISVDADDAYADCYGGGFSLTTTATSVYATLRSAFDWHGFLRIYVDLAADSNINSATLNIYERADGMDSTIRYWRVAGSNWTTAPEDLSSRPSLDDRGYVEFDSDSTPNEWKSLDITEMFLDFYTEGGYSSDNYIGFEFNRTNVQNSFMWGFEDYQHTGTHHSYIEVDLDDSEHYYVDWISDLRTPSDIGTHSDFSEEQDKDGSYDTLTEVTFVEIPSEWKYVDDLSTAETVWTTVGASPYLAAQDEPTNRIYTSSNGAISSWYTLTDTSGYSSGSDTFTVNVSVYWKAVSDSYVEWEVDWTSDGTADDSGSFTTQAAYSWDNTGTLSGLDTVSEINQARIRFTHNKGAGGPELVDIDAARIGIAETGTNYELDLEVGWVTADYDESSEELCIFGGTQGSEALRVDVWSGSWTNVFTDIAVGWNNVSVTSYLTDATFEIRFTDTTNESVLADTWQVEAVLLHTWSAAGNEYVEYVFETIPLSDSSAVSMGASETVNEVISVSDTSIDSVGFGLVVTELIGFYDSVVVAMDAVLIIMEQINFAETVSVGASFVLTVLEVLGLAASVVASRGTQVTVFENIGLYDSITATQQIQFYIYETIGLTDLTTVAASYQNTVFESISLLDLTVVSATYPITVFESIGLIETISTTQQIQFYIYETIGLTDLTTVAASYQNTVFETIGFTDLIAASRGLSITVFEIIGLLELTATSQLTHYYVYEVIGVISSIGVIGGAVPTPPTTSMFYQLFFSLDMWGYLGPLALVIIGYIVASKDKNLGVLWFMLESLVIANYLTLVAETPEYWWHIFILLIGCMSTLMYSIGDRW